MFEKKKTLTSARVSLTDHVEAAHQLTKVLGHCK